MTKQGARTRSKGARTKERISQGVQNLLAVRDFNDVSIEDVVQETGIPVGSIYFHFKNKDNLMHAIAETAINDFFLYFESIEDEDLFGAAFLYAWRMIQQQINRRGQTQLSVWHLYQDGENLSRTWLPKRAALQDSFAKIIARENNRANPTANDKSLAELLLLGTENMAVTMTLTGRMPPGTDSKPPQDIASDIAKTWYRAAVGKAPDGRKTAAAVKRIVKDTKMLTRPIALPDAG